jgi:hypothetical protein
MSELYKLISAVAKSYSMQSVSVIIVEQDQLPHVEESEQWHEGIL